jgi:glycosyltransferase involved in cell wall biosynthesis
MNKPFFTVIIPALNEEKYLPVLLKSLGKQTYRDFEVILVDGKSTDNTLKVFEKYRDKLPQSKVLIAEKQHPGHQRNIGAKAASGEYLFFIDADCDINETFIEELHVAAIKHKFQFATTYIRADSENSSDKLLMNMANMAQELTRLLDKPFSGGYNTIIKKPLFFKLKGFREDVIINEDVDLAWKAHKIHITPLILRNLTVVFSLRRWRKEGVLPLLRDYAKTTVYSLIRGPVTKKLIKYDMGGHVFEGDKKKSVKLVQLERYLKSMKSIEEKINKLLKDI